ncbi:hypothetical protein PSTG_10412 [Puccinia striiformis f. sp. tritici PST-78]|uniref:Uncharacterized protein n=1 Tax=Puccinia striiformis f. sp. tritici PST-78 TaxID=1165861 RepID=A0A0L0VAI5_9BASI|nr:hypothetical protein PSTG_10412 [Puccinia striiformis f. sp. tritici PST-78]
MWVMFYKSAPIDLAPTASLTPTSKPKSSMLAGLGDTAKARGGQCSSNLLDVWLAGGLILEDNEPVNPLKWWLWEKRLGNTHGGSCAGMAVAFYLKNGMIPDRVLHKWKSGIQAEKKAKSKEKGKKNGSCR